MEKPKLTAINVVAVSFVLFDPLVENANVAAFMLQRRF
jgi:hypothetical protein